MLYIYIYTYIYIMLEDLVVQSYLHFASMMFSHGVLVAVERGVVELRKLSIEQQLWEASRRETDQSSFAPVANHKRTDSELSS